tara:strand:- start:545 stop:817 length:273 start_codon:yes stop_codon:yes gene_type:complete
MQSNARLTPKAPTFVTGDAISSPAGVPSARSVLQATGKNYSLVWLWLALIETNGIGIYWLLLAFIGFYWLCSTLRLPPKLELQNNFTVIN